MHGKHADLRAPICKNQTSFADALSVKRSPLSPIIFISETIKLLSIHGRSLKKTVYRIKYFRANVHWPVRNSARGRDLGQVSNTPRHERSC